MNREKKYNGKIYKYKTRNILEFIMSLIVFSYRCEICRRKSIWSVKKWYYMDKKENGDFGIKVMCNKCAEMNNLDY